MDKPDRALEEIKKDIKTAVKAQDAQKAERLRYLFSLVQKQEAKTGPLKEDQVMAILNKEMKSKKEALAMFEKAERKELVDKEREEIILLKKYLPDQMGEEEVRKTVSAVVGKASGQNFGAIMGQVMGQLKGKADGNLVAKIVKESLEKS